MNGPFKLIKEKVKRRVLVRKYTTTSLLVLSDVFIILGTSEGSLLVKSNQQDTLVTELKSKKAVSKLVYIHKNNLLLAVCGGELFTLDGKTLERRPAFQNLRDVTDVCLNQRGPPDWGVCIATQTPNVEDGSLHLYAYLSNDQQLEKLREIPLKGLVGTPTQVCWYETVLCVGGTKSAGLLDDVSGSWKSIPIVVDAKRGPLILPLPDGQILLTSAGGVGVIIDLEGLPVSNGAIVWSSPVICGLCLCGPYLITLTELGVVEIALRSNLSEVIQRLEIPEHSLTINSNYKLIGEQLFSSTSESNLEDDANENQLMFAVGLSNQHHDTPFRMAQAVPLSVRIRDLLEEDAAKNCQTAVELISTSLPVSTNFEAVQKRIQQCYVQAAVGCIKQTRNYALAFELLTKGQAKISEVLGLGGYLNMVNLEGLHNWYQDAQLKEMDLFEENLFLKEALEFVRKKYSPTDCKNSQLNTAIVDFYSQVSIKLKQSKYDEVLEGFCLQEDIELDVNTCQASLEQKDPSRFKLSLAHLLAKSSDPDLLKKALLLYTDLQLKPFVMHLLKKHPNKEFFLSHLTYLFNSQTSSDDDDLLELLSLYGPLCNPNDQLETLLLQLPTLSKPKYFIAKVVQSKNNPIPLARAYIIALEEALSLGDLKHRDKISGGLLRLVNTVDPVYQTSPAEAALDAISKSKMASRMGRERAACLGALGRHSEALRIFVVDLNDNQGAESYCLLHSSLHCQKLVERSERGVDEADAGAMGVKKEPDPFISLLAIHLERFTENNTKSREGIVKDFLNQHGSKINAVEVLNVLPDTIALHTCLHFLEDALNNVTHHRRQKKLEKNLARAENLQVKVRLTHLQKKFVVISTQTLCDDCGLPFDDASVSVKPMLSGVSHLECKPRSLTNSALKSITNRKLLSKQDQDMDQSDFVKL